MSAEIKQTAAAAALKRIIIVLLNYVQNAIYSFRSPRSSSKNMSSSMSKKRNQRKKAACEIERERIP
jgi:hypothetical protein